MGKQSESYCWATKSWLHEFYLSPRFPIPRNVSPCLILPNLGKSLLKLSKFAFSVRNIYLQILNGHIFSQTKSSNLCNAQYKIMFETYREPGIELDKHIKKSMDQEKLYFLAAFQNAFFKIELDSISRIFKNLEKVISFVSESSVIRDQEIINPTSAFRPTAAEFESYLKQKCPDQISIIQNALFVICLDTHTSTSNTGVFNHKNFLEYLNNTTSNRWFNHSLQFVYILKQGSFGLIYEHSVCEGIVVVDVLEKIFQDNADELENSNFCCSQLYQDPKPLIDLSVKFNDKQNFYSSSNYDHKKTLFKTKNLANISKNLLKSLSISPDSFIQIALNLTFLSIHSGKTLPNTYESGGLRKFHNARVENIRSSEISLKKLYNFLEIVRQNASNENLEKANFLLRASIENQSKIMRSAVEGKGMDNILTVMRQMTADESLELPKPNIFKHHHFQKIDHFELSTSQVATKDILSNQANAPEINNNILAYGPTTDLGYSCSYILEKNYFLYNLGKFFWFDLDGNELTGENHVRQELEEFSSCFEKILNEMVAYLCG